MLVVFSLVLLLYDYEIVSADMETVKDLKNVADFQNFKVLKKIKSLTPIDDDLAIKIKEEISEGKSLLNTVNNKLNDANKEEMSHEELKKKVDRILDLFNISDLDEIVNVRQVGAEESSNRDGIGGEEKFQDLGRERPDARDEDMKFNLMSTEIHSLDKLLEKLLSEVKKKKDDYETEKRATVALAKLLKAQSKKLKLIQQTLSKHSDNAVTAHKEIAKLFDRIRELQVEKIESLDKLRSMAENKENEELELIRNSKSQSELDSSEFEEEENKNLDLLHFSEEEEDESRKKIDSSKYNVYPLKKILSMKKIKSIVELTDEQARRLKKMQNQKEM